MTDVGKYAAIVALMLVCLFGTYFALDFASTCAAAAKALIKRWLDPKLLVREPLSPPCAHDWSVEHVTYSPPRDNTWLFQLEPGEARERGMHGCTSIMRRCEICKRTDVRVLLGKQIPAPSTWTVQRHTN